MNTLNNTQEKINLSVGMKVISTKGESCTITSFRALNDTNYLVQYINEAGEGLGGSCIIDRKGASFVAYKEKVKKEGHKSRGEKKRESDDRAREARKLRVAKMSDFEKIRDTIMCINKLQYAMSGNTRITYYDGKLEDLFSGIQLCAKELGNAMILDIVTKCDRYKNCSIKQAACLAYFVIKNKGHEWLSEASVNDAISWGFF